MSDNLSGSSELQALLRAIATMSCEVAEALELTSSGIAEALMKAGTINREVMVKLQAFDRMHQELDVISNVVEHCSILMNKADVGIDEVETIVSGISLAQFRHRLEYVLANSLFVGGQIEPEPEQVY